MIDLALNNIWLLGAALVIGIVTGRWAFSTGKPKPPETKQEDDAQS
ncbi:MAG TPA: hypothetical protein VEC11_06680 [Allosphingosinicella sp.]|nr:hypothetical protein [Allosphingosinicella sp.]